MNEEKIVEFLVEFKASIAELNQMMKSTLERISNHEGRITNLEQNKVGFKDQVVKWLAIGLIGTIAIIASLTGSTALITTMLGQNQSQTYLNSNNQ